jgi:hypothetical protein
MAPWTACSSSSVEPHALRLFLLPPPSVVVCNTSMSTLCAALRACCLCELPRKTLILQVVHASYRLTAAPVMSSTTPTARCQCVWWVQMST